ncbi:MAG: DUF1273 domain-containing protein [Eubacterium sp.]|nr:DUF1273 domain-containing protein [Eubacterium sp.]
MGKICCGFGHREVHQDITQSLERAVNSAIEVGCTEFLNGDMGAFDRQFYTAVKKAKSQHPEIKITCVKPYMTKALQQYKDFYADDFDEIVIPEESASAHYKSAITKRNQWMIDKSEVVLIYTVREHGGAFTAQKYAAKHNKTIIQI